MRITGFLKRLHWTVAASLLVEALCVTSVASSNGPAVFGLALGVETTKGMTARGASKDVADFCSALLATYNNASIKQLRNEAATREAFEDWVREAKDLPAESVVVVYFSGHGIRTKDEDRDLRFLLSGANANEEKPSLKVSFSFRELVAALSEVKRATVMVFLDCCYSGLTKNDEMFFETSFKTRFDCRAFVLSSVADNEEGFGTKEGGYFTQSVLEVMKLNDAAGCLTVENLYKGVDDLIVNKKQIKGIHPYYWKSGNMDRCLARLGDPYFYVVVSFDRPPEGILDMTLNGAITHRFRCSPEERTFRSSLPKGTHSLKIRSTKYEDYEVIITDNNARQGLLRTNISLKLRLGYKESPSTLSSHAVDSVVETAERSVAMHLPTSLTASLYIEAAFDLIRLKISDDSSALLKLAKQYDPNNTFLTLACASKEESKVIAQKLSLQEIGSERIRHDLELAGRFDIAAEVNSVLFSKLSEEAAIASAALEKERIANEQAVVAVRAAANRVAIEGEPINLKSEHRLSGKHKSDIDRVQRIKGESAAAKTERRDAAREALNRNAFRSASKE